MVQNVKGKNDWHKNVVKTLRPGNNKNTTLSWLFNNHHYAYVILQTNCIGKFLKMWKYNFIIDI
jgi:hypothetical protein